MENLGKLNLRQQGLYTIEVNDEGETIVIDTENIELPLKVQKMYEDCEKIEKQTNLQIKAIEKKPLKNKGFLTNHDEEIIKLTKKACMDIRKALDTVLGEGACQKIFGDRNYLSMYTDLMDALTPHFEKIGVLNAEKTKEAIAEKYTDDGEGVI